jgi:hypothetical protein
VNRDGDALNPSVKLKDAVLFQVERELSVKADGMTETRRMTHRSDEWTYGYMESNEDNKLRDVVPTHGGKDWVTVVALVPSRIKRQCYDRWTKYVDSGRSTDREEEHDALNKTPTLEQDGSSPLLSCARSNYDYRSYILWFISLAFMSRFQSQTRRIERLD